MAGVPPPVVVADELAGGRLVERCRVPGLTESFYAITVQRRFLHPALRGALGSGSGSGSGPGASTGAGIPSGG